MKTITFWILAAALLAYGALVVYERGNNPKELLKRVDTTPTHQQEGVTAKRTVPGEAQPAVEKVQPLDPAKITKAGPWTWEQDVEVTGLHFPGGFGENCKDVFYEVVSGPGRIETDQRVVKQDEDTRWTFYRLSDRKAQWHICANNCTFSCDTIILHLMGRTIQTAKNESSGGENKKASTSIRIEIRGGGSTGQLDLIHNLIADNTWRSLDRRVLGADSGVWVRKQGTDGTSVMLQANAVDVLEILGTRPVTGVGVPFQNGDSGRATHFRSGFSIPGGTGIGSVGQVNWRVTGIN